MPNCPKCGKPVFFAERRLSLGKDWHPWCLKCELCGKTLNPSRHSEHKGTPYCDVPCYSALYGPGGFGRGGTESHKVFGCVADSDKQAHRNELIRKIKLYNATLAGTKLTLNFSEANHEVFFEGILRIHWRVKKPVKLLEKNFVDAQNFISYANPTQHRFTKKSAPPNKRPVSISSPTSKQEIRMKLKQSGFTLIKPVPPAKYQSELFTPDDSFTTNVFITNQVKSQQVIQQIIKKYQIADSISQFILCVNYNNGGVRILEKDDYPLQIRVNLGPSDAHAKLSIMHCDDDSDTRLTFQAAQYACLTLQQLQMCLNDIETEEHEKNDMLREKYRNIRTLIDELIPVE